MTTPVKLGDDPSKIPLGIKYKEVHDRFKSVSIHDQAFWDFRVTEKPDGEPVNVVGVIYQQGQTPSAIPNSLMSQFNGQTPVQLRLKYEG